MALKDTLIQKYIKKIPDIESSLEETNIQVTNLEENKAEKIEVNKINTKLSRTFRATIYKCPFSFELFKMAIVKKYASGLIESGFEPELLFPNIEGKTYYVDNINGSSSNDGLTINTAFEHIRRAIVQSDVKEIIVRGGIYSASEVFEIGKMLTKSIKIKSYDKNPVILVHDHCAKYAWTVHSGSCYKTNRSQSIQMWDLKHTDDYGDAFHYVRKQDIQGVIDNEGTYFTDTDGTLYVHCKDNRKPDKELIFNYEAHNLLYFNNVTLYVENIRFFGGAKPVEILAVDNSTYGVFLAKNCHMAYASKSNLGNGVNTLGGDAFLLNCSAYRNRRDGFNYHQNSDGSRQGFFIEVNCIGRHNGLEDSNNANNGTTAHDGCIGIRVNGLYFQNKGPTVADVNNSKTYNIGCCAFDCANTSVENFGYYERDNAEMYLEDCSEYGNTYGAYAYGKHIQAKNCSFENPLQKVMIVDEFIMA